MERQQLTKAESEHQLRAQTANTSSLARPSLRSLLQRQLGNQAMGHILQAKLKVNEPGDEYEQEADRNADQVMRMPDPNPPAFAQDVGPRIQRKCAACASGQGLCPQCAEEELTVQRKAVDADLSSGEAPPLVHDVLNSPGEPLDPATRAFFEPRFSHDFSQVRVHTDSKAAESAQAVNALAYTSGRNVVFGIDQYRPTTAAGRRLLAHELVHAVQQGAVAKDTDRTWQSGSTLTGGSGLAFVKRNANGLAEGEIVTDASTVPATRSWIQREPDPIVSASDAVELTQTATNGISMPGRVSKIKDLATKLASVGLKCKEDPGWLSKDKEKLANAAILADLSTKIAAVYNELEKAVDKELKENKVGPLETRLEKLTYVLKAADLIAALNDDSDLKAMQANPNDYGKAKAWAKRTADAFKKAGELIPDKIDGIAPGWLSYFKLMFSAPSIYVNAFTAIMEKRYETIDKETGLFSTKYKQGAWADGKYEWEGELTGIFIGAQFVDGNEKTKLQDFMKENRKINGIDIYSVTKAVGKALLMTAIGEKVLDNASKTRWLNYLTKSR